MHSCFSREHYKSKNPSLDQLFFLLVDFQSLVAYGPRRINGIALVGDATKGLTWLSENLSPVMQLLHLCNYMNPCSRYSSRWDARWIIVSS